MTESDGLVEGFEEHRPRLRAVAYRVLGSLAEADDAVQEAWIRFSRADASGVDNLPGWLTTIVVRVSLNALRSRNSRREDPLGVHVPDPVVSRPEGLTPEDEALLADSVGLALQVVLDTLAPAERLAFVLHDMFDLPFDEIGPMVGRAPATARQLASRARRRVRGAEVPTPDTDVGRQREVVDAFFAAARRGELDALVTVLDPDVVLRSDGGRPDASVRGPRRGRRCRPGSDVRAARRTDAAGTGERSRGRGREPRRTPGLGHGIHRLGRQDCGNRRDGRSRAPHPAQPGRSRLTFTPRAAISCRERPLCPDRGRSSSHTERI